jgi:hypothetical protein
VPLSSPLHQPQMELLAECRAAYCCSGQVPPAGTVPSARKVPSARIAPLDKGSTNPGQSVVAVVLRGLASAQPRPRPQPQPRPGPRERLTGAGSRERQRQQLPSRSGGCAHCSRCHIPGHRRSPAGSPQSLCDPSGSHARRVPACICIRPRCDGSCPCKLLGLVCHPA